MICLSRYLDAARTRGAFSFAATSTVVKIGKTQIAFRRDRPSSEDGDIDDRRRMCVCVCVCASTCFVVGYCSDQVENDDFYPENDNANY